MFLSEMADIIAPRALMVELHYKNRITVCKQFNAAHYIEYAKF